MDITERIKKTMEAKGINQKELSKMTNITEASISKYLNGSRTPRIDVIFNLANALDVTVDYLLGNDKKIVKPFEANYQLLTRTKSDLTPEERRKLINILLES